MGEPLAWVSSYNHRRRTFDNGVSWYRFYFRIGARWFTPGGVRLEGRRVKYLRRDRAMGPLR